MPSLLVQYLTTVPRFYKITGHEKMDVWIEDPMKSVVVEVRGTLSLAQAAPQGHTHARTHIHTHSLESKCYSLNSGVMSAFVSWGSRVGQNHIYTVYIRHFWHGNHQMYGHIRCIYTVLANPMRQRSGTCTRKSEESYSLGSARVHGLVVAHVLGLVTCDCTRAWPAS